MNDVFKKLHHPSVMQICERYFSSINEETRILDAWYFCDNEEDANECAELVLDGIKTATSPSLWWHEYKNVPIPKEGDLNVVTDWDGEAKCIIQTIGVDIVAFNKISAEYAELEGEGDKSLAYWKRVHWAYYQRELSEVNMTPTEDMPIVCETFKVVFR